ncbi:MAG: PDZ domain-containing protein [Phycisphaerales bacterium]
MKAWFHRLCVAGMLGGAAPASAQELPPPVPDVPAPAVLPDLKRLVADLGAADLATREAGSEQITKTRSIRLRHLEPLLRDPTLSPEQRVRLTSLARDRFWSEPRAAMGVRSEGPFGSTRGVVLTLITPGFPAAEVLKVGDRVEVLDGIRLEVFETFRHVIISHDPGDEISASIVRDGVTLALKIKLGHFAALGMQLDDQILEAGWRLRSRPFAALGAPPTGRIRLDPPVLAIAHDAAMQQGMVDADAGPVGVVAGGEARESRPPPPQMPAAQRGGPRMIGNQVPAARRGEADILRAQLRLLEDTRSRALEELQSVALRLADATIQGAAREELERRRVSLSGLASVYSDQIDQIQGRLNRMGR